MERKRKLPARAAARVESASKRQSSSSTSPEVSFTPAPPPEPTEPAAHDVSASIASAALPKSLQPGQPLPTVEKPQPDDLSLKDFQSIQESGVLSESLSRSRQKWIDDGIFEKYWTKPSKRKGVAKEDTNNPAKDTMVKIGQVTITVEPHILDATLFGVKDPKPASHSSSTTRPVLQYGPPNGAMPPPRKPTNANISASAAASSPSSGALIPPTTSTTPTQPALPTSQVARPSPLPTFQSRDDEKLSGQQLPPPTGTPLSGPAPSHQTETHRPPLPSGVEKPSQSPRGLESVLAPPQHGTLSAPDGHPRPSQPQSQPQPQPPLPQRMTPMNHQTHAPTNPPSQLHPGLSLSGSGMTTTNAAPQPPKPAPAPAPAAAPAPGADPIIVTLAEKASEDPQLRDLMKRVAVGEAAPAELAHFQKIIDQITAEYKRKGGQQGPSAERIILDGRSIKWFADEVQNILDIVLAAEPNLKAGNLRAPPDADPVVILLVREALDNPGVRAKVKRIADGKTEFSDATDLKSHMDRVLIVAKQDAEAQEQANRMDTGEKSDDAPEHMRKVLNQPQNSPAPQSPSTSQQALRSKGPPPPPTKPEYSAVVLEFVGGTGDRYLFPKYSVLQFSEDGTEVIASFLLVRRGSNLEYGGDPTLDYYQPITLRLHSSSPKVLEHLARTVAPKEDVQRYMDDVMDNMTRADYVLLAMRLPRGDKEERGEDREDTARVSEVPRSSLPPVLWDSNGSRPNTSRPSSSRPPSSRPVGEDEQYQAFITSVSQPPAAA
ncbi:hypothetical protein GGS20DRAFT_529170 [Poronia punctata]|nr:hypothetical protein GGS20DRAFT_529170 [Poronia punctata]